MKAVPFQFNQFESIERYMADYACTIFLNTMVYARTNMRKIFTEERSHIFVKEPEGSSEKILKY